jgi:hypothetical protein
MMGLAWLLGVFVVLSAARFKRADYLLPAYPGAAIFLGCSLETMLAGRWRKLVLTSVVTTALVMIVGWTVRIGWGLPAEEPYRDYRVFASLVREHVPSPNEVIFFRTEAHALAFRVGQPVHPIVQWSCLQKRLEQPGEHWIVLPMHVWTEAQAALPGIELQEVARNTTLAGGRHERPLLLARVPRRDHHACVSHVTPNRPRPAQRDPVGTR